MFGLLNRYASFFNKHRLVKNISVLALGSSIAQIITFGTTLVLCRLFSPSEFAIFAWFLSFVAVLSELTTWRYSLAIILPKSIADAAKVVTLCVVLALISGCCFEIVAVFSGMQIIQLISAIKPGMWILWFPIAMLVNGIGQTYSYWLNRNNGFKESALYSVFQSLCISAASVTLGVAGLGVSGLIVGTILGRISSLILIALFFDNFGLFRLMKCDIKQLLAILKRYKEYPLCNAPAAVADNLAQSAPIWYLAYAFESSVLGLYFFAVRILCIPAALFSSAISQTVMQEVSECYKNHIPVRKRLVQVGLVLVLLYAPIMIVLIVAGEPLFSLLFGKEWQEAGCYAAVLSISFFVKFIVSPLSIVLASVEKIKWASFWQIGYLLTVSITLLVGSRFGVYTFMLMLTVHDVILYGIYFVLIWIAAGQCKDRVLAFKDPLPQSPTVA